MSDDRAELVEVDQSRHRLYGPRCLLVCGLEPEDQERMQGMADGLGDLKVVFAGAGDTERRLGELLDYDDAYGLGQPASLPAAIIMSGLSGEELHLLMATYRKLALPAPLWATLTPTSEKWPLGKLLAELAAEHASFEGEGGSS
ncbi:MAG: DUF3783 domain-containing protein [Deltaproteobacteria bacterium]|nr:DUF3783 domain-containing protein [Deltaproteobacteria bacterium]